MDAETIKTLGLPIALCIAALVAVWNRGVKTDATLMAAHAERIRSLEMRTEECERDRNNMRAALADLTARRRAALGVKPTQK
jgi:C4-dicarboxylate-specific signal transduction histidine kinase